MASGGVSDLIQVLKETAFGDGGAAGEKVFGVTKTFTWNVDTSTLQSFGLETSGPAGTFNVDGVFAVTGTHVWELVDGREFEAIMGTLVDNDPDFTLSVANTLPSYSVKAVDEAGDSKYVIIKGLKYSRFSIALTRDDTIQITADWFAKTIENTTTFTPTVATVEPLTYLDGYFQSGTVDVAEVEDITLEINRNCQPHRFIENTASGSRRLISEIIEGPLNITFNGSAAAQREMLEELFGGSTMQDVRSDKNMALITGRGTSALELNITGGRYITTGRTLDKTAEVAVQDFGGIGLSISGTGTYGG